MRNEDIIKNLNKHSFVSSWLLWDEGDNVGKGREWIKTLEDDINTKYVFVALNPSCKSDEFDIEKWGSFHTGKKGDLNLKLAFENTEYKGCYVTDILKYNDIQNTKPFNKGDSNSVMVEIYKNPEIYSHNARIFEKELKCFDDVKVIFAFGWDVYRMLLFNPNIIGNHKVVRLPHFSPRNYNGKDDYKEVINKELKNHNLPQIEE